MNCRTVARQSQVGCELAGQLASQGRAAKSFAAAPGPSTDSLDYYSANPANHPIIVAKSLDLHVCMWVDLHVGWCCIYLRKQLARYMLRSQ